ncbi:hypothetical protein B0T16DRAFT_457270 [Cercophora newfieldiana]|uniref:Invertebrate defensins family profile domain-containing protein n=1 Tax=Cercophora newfieldiana TaxID=92897 RepID=A0AA39YC37_9PEZI|nr:hypothetical protein B0T16DRAFT_457270 [Cercophora newfieldiana]
MRFSAITTVLVLGLTQSIGALPADAAGEPAGVIDLDGDTTANPMSDVALGLAEIAPQECCDDCCAGIGGGRLCNDRCRNCGAGYKSGSCGGTLWQRCYCYYDN